MDSKIDNQGNPENLTPSRGGGVGRTFRGSPRNSPNASNENSVPKQKNVNTSSTNDFSTSPRNVTKSTERNRTNSKNDVEGENEDNAWAVPNAHKKRGQNREYRQGYKQYESSEQGGSRPFHSFGTADSRSRPPRGGGSRGMTRGRYERRRGSDFDHRRGRDNNMHRPEVQSNISRKPAAGPCSVDSDRENAWTEKAKNDKDAASAKFLEKDDLKGITPESKEQEDEMLQMAVQLSLQETQRAGVGAPTLGRNCTASPDTDPYFDEGEEVSQVLLQPTEFPPLPSSNADIPIQAISPPTASLSAGHPSILPQVKVSGWADNGRTSSAASKKSSAVAGKNAENWDKLGARPKTQMSVAATASRGIGRAGGRGRPNSSVTGGDAVPKVGEWVTTASGESNGLATETPTIEPVSNEQLHPSENVPQAVGNGTSVVSVARASPESFDAVPPSVFGGAHTKKTNDPHVVLLSRNKCDAFVEDDSTKSRLQATENASSDRQAITERSLDLFGCQPKRNDAPVVSTSADDETLFGSQVAHCDLRLVAPREEPDVLPCQVISVSIPDEVPICKRELSVDGGSSFTRPTDVGPATIENHVVREIAVSQEAVTRIESRSSSAVVEVQQRWAEPPKDEKDELIAQLCKKIEMLQKQGPSSESANAALQATYPAYPIPVPFYPFPVAVPFPMLSNGGQHVSAGGLHDSTYQQMSMVPVADSELSSSNADLSGMDTMLQHSGSRLSPNAPEFVPQDYLSLPNLDHGRRDFSESYESREGRGRGMRGGSRSFRRPAYGVRYRQQSSFPQYSLGVRPLMPQASGLDLSYASYLPAAYPTGYPTSAGYGPNSSNTSPNSQHQRVFHRNGSYASNNYYTHYQ